MRWASWRGGRRPILVHNDVPESPASPPMSVIQGNRANRTHACAHCGAQMPLSFRDLCAIDRWRRWFVTCARCGHDNQLPILWDKLLVIGATMIGLFVGMVLVSALLEILALGPIGRQVLFVFLGVATAFLTIHLCIGE